MDRRVSFQSRFPQSRGSIHSGAAARSNSWPNPIPIETICGAVALLWRGDAVMMHTDARIDGLRVCGLATQRHGVGVGWSDTARRAQGANDGRPILPARMRVFVHTALDARWLMEGLPEGGERSH